MGQTSDALMDLEKAIELDPQNPLPYVHRSFCVGGINPLAAFSDAEKALQYGRNIPIAHIQLAKLHALSQDFATAEKVIKSALEILPSSMELYNALCEIMIAKTSDQAENPQLLEMIEKAISTKPFDPRGHLIKGAYYIRLADEKAALAAFNKAIELEPSFAYPYFEVAMVHAMASNEAESLKYMNKALELASNERELLQSLRLVVDLQSQLKVVKRYPQLREKLR